MSDKTHRLASVLADHIPDGFQLEIRNYDGVSIFRYKRISDEVWCQEAMSNLVIEQAILSPEALADHILRSAAQKFRDYDALDGDRAAVWSP
jgi:hypothetical protein